MKKNLLLFLVIWVVILNVQATHNRAGEITYVHRADENNQYRYEIIITTYTKQSSFNADRDSLTINWGDNSSTVLPRNNGFLIDGNFNGELLGNDIKKNVYSGIHNYPGPGDYLLWMQDLNRVDSIVNINYGNSMNEPFYIENTLKILDPQFYSFNNSPQLLQPPIDFAGLGIPYIHNPNAFDVDGDSLHFELIKPEVATDEAVSNYDYPDSVASGPNNSYFLNPVTGEFVWDAPQQTGIYNIAIKISEFRDGLCIGTMRRDMQIIVVKTDNLPPILSALNDTCIIAGSTIKVNIEAIDDDPEIIVDGFGGSFELENSPATLTIDSMVAGLTQATFNWETNCNHILNQPYTIVIKAEDENASNAAHITLADLSTWLINVVPPAPQNLTYQIINKSNVLLSWQNPYACFDADKFYGFSIWRGQGCDTIQAEICDVDNGLSGYEQIASNLNDYMFLDETALKGVAYTYKVVAEFAEISLGGFPLNVVQSIPSNGGCVFLPSDVPVITNVSITTTNEFTGEAYLAWSKPNGEALDTIFNTPPYVYKVFRSDGIGTTNFNLITETAPANTFAAANDTIFIDEQINTQTKAYTYKIGFYSAADLVGDSNAASSVFLNALPGSTTANLSWSFQVPWSNNQYIIYRSESGTSTFDSITTVSKNKFTDENLINGLEYCYYVEAIGTYETVGIIDPLINLSQINCAIPVDTMPPCTPELTLTNDCSLNLLVWEEDNFRNDLNWQPCTEPDLQAYNIYYATDSVANLTLLATINELSITEFQHFINGSIAGCYSVTAVDSFKNESPLNNIVCIENCLNFELPNTFTPNNDGQNDTFEAINNRFVQRIDLKIFNRWGNLVFKTTAPNFEWDGTNMANNKPLADGVYFYTCDVFQTTTQNAELLAFNLNGSIHLIKKTN